MPVAACSLPRAASIFLPPNHQSMSLFIKTLLHLLRTHLLAFQNLAECVGAVLKMLA